MSYGLDTSTRPLHSAADIARVQAGLRHEYIRMPYQPRNWARRFHRKWLRGFALVLHRRAGKTTSILNHHVRGATDDHWEAERLLRTIEKPVTKRELKQLLEERTYWHIYPTLTQGEKVAWPLLKRYVDGFPGRRYNQQKLRVTFPKGHVVQIIGADDPDSLRGPGLSGVGYDEYSQQPPNIHGEIISKALGDHLGYYIFAGTIKGTDHLYKTHAAAKRSPAKWFALWQTVTQSLNTETGITIKLLEQAMADDRQAIADGLMSQAEYDQEWFLAEDAAIKGAFYGKEMMAIRQSGRILKVPYDPDYPVDTMWDLGMDDTMPIWFLQRIGREARFIDFYEASGEGLAHYAKILQDKGYIYGSHYAPHDIKVKELGTGTTRYETAKRLGIKFTRVKKVDTAGIANGVNAVRLLLARAVFDEEKCAKGLHALRNYKRQYNKALNEYTATPVHDWASHPADAMRTGAVAYKFPESITDLPDDKEDDGMEDWERARSGGDRDSWME